MTIIYCVAVYNSSTIYTVKIYFYNLNQETYKGFTHL